MKISTLLGVYLALLVLLALTAFGYQLPPGPWNAPLALLIALAKSALIGVYFMRWKERSGVIRLIALASFFWILIAGLLTFSDYFTRENFF